MRTEIETKPADITTAERTETSCPACGGPAVVDFFETRGLPVHVGIFYDSQAAARRAPSGDIVLAYCRGCGFVHNRLFDRAKLHYQPGYEVALHHSPVFREFLHGVADRLIERFELRDKSILEIGCGDGYFLRRLCEQGANRGTGYDPTVRREGTEDAGPGRVQFVRDYFSERHGPIDADFICCLSVFEHIPEPGQFVQGLRRQIGQRRAGLYFEVFNAAEAFRRRETWSIHYEACNYFSRDALAGLFARNGFEVLDARSCYQGDQYLSVDAVAGEMNTPRSSRPSVAPVEGGLPAEIEQFGETHQQNISLWTRRLAEFRAGRMRVVVWGSGGKGISFLNSVPTAESIEYVVEINPDKHGKFVPGSGQRIVPPSFLTEYQPEVVIITNALYEAEMKQQARELGVECDFVVA